RNTEQWLEREPSFHADRIRTPTMFTENGADIGSPVSTATIGAFVLNRRPIEYLFFPQARHVLARPRERVTAMQAVVDWMDFWLQRREEPITLNDRLCSRSDVRSAQGAETGERNHVAGAQSPDEPPWSWLDCTEAGLANARSDRAE